MTPMMAIETLAEDMWYKFQSVAQDFRDTHLKYGKDCCKWHMENSDKRNCGVCGGNLYNKLYVDDLVSFIRSLHDSDCDNYGESECFYLSKEDHRCAVWYPWWPDRAIDFIKKDQYMSVPENAATIIAAVAMKKHPDKLLQSKDDYNQVSSDIELEFREDTHELHVKFKWD